MGNYLKMADRQRIQALLELGWSYRRIERETGVRRETIARYDARGDPEAAKVAAGPVAKLARVPTGSASACERYREIIEVAVTKGLSAQRIWQDLQEDYGFSHSYCSVKRFVRTLKRRHPEVAGFDCPVTSGNTYSEATLIHHQKGYEALLVPRVKVD